MDNNNVEKLFGGFFKVYPGKQLSVEEKKKKHIITHHLTPL